MGNKVKALGGREKERRLRVATWTFQGWVVEGDWGVVNKDCTMTVKLDQSDYSKRG